MTPASGDDGHYISAFFQKAGQDRIFSLIGAELTAALNLKSPRRQ